MDSIEMEPTIGHENVDSSLFQESSSHSTRPMLSLGPLHEQMERSGSGEVAVGRGEGDDKQRDHNELSVPTSSSTQKKDHPILYAIYTSASAVIGSCLRVYVARIFGEDCEEGAIVDFLTPFSKLICVTAGGRTTQTGGALFRDLPANMLGSFVMGAITPRHHSCRIPWFHRSHHLQSDDVFHTSLGVGLCGCLTTFASCNSQMVVMLDGSYCQLGSQVVPALCGYLIGILLSVSSFKSGRWIAFWVYSAKHSKEKGDEETGQNGDGRDSSISDMISKPRQGLRPMYAVFAVVIVLVALLIVGDFKYGNLFYRKMYLTACFSPFGALLRWWLSVHNDGSERKFVPWLPRGTLAANLVGAVVSILIVGLSDRYNTAPSLSGHPWNGAVLSAIKTGFAGSLSTVSSFVKEIVLLSESYPGHAKPKIYGFMTVVGGLFLGLTVYAAIARPS